MNNRRLPFIILTVIAFIVILALSSSLFYTISATERAVLFYPFGKGLDKDNVQGPGTHMKAPRNDVYVYKVNETSAEENMDVLDKNGLSIHIDITVRYYPIPDKIGYIHEQFTNDYETVLVIPEVRSTVRQVMGRYTAEEIYSTKRAEVETAIKSETEKILNTNNVHATAVLIRSIQLPEQIRIAIESKLQQEQEALAYQFRLIKKKAKPNVSALRPRGNRVQTILLITV